MIKFLNVQYTCKCIWTVVADKKDWQDNEMVYLRGIGYGYKDKCKCPECSKKEELSHAN